MTDTQHTNSAFTASFDPATGVATLLFAMPGKVNKVDKTMALGLQEAFTWCKTREGIKGVILGTAHRFFCVGADIDSLYPMRDPKETFDYVQSLNALFRSLETAGFPVVCALTGSALGGGYELALACHKRFAIDDARIQIGLPEVTLGVIPGAGGTQRLPRIIGIQKAIEHISQGQPVRVQKAKQLGMVDELFATPDELIAAAHAWIVANPKAKQPWDDKGFKFPAPGPETADTRNMLMVACAMTYKKVANSMPQIEAAICAIHEGAQVNFDSALLVESRYFVRCAVSDTSKDMIRTFWFHRNAALKAEGMPQAAEHGFKKVAILGAGMMGAGLAFICAEKGFTVVVKDIAETALTAAKQHCIDEAKKKKHLSAEAQQAIIDRITFSLEDDAVRGSDLVIEAIIENDAVKHKVTRTLEPLLAEGGIWASNTSAIPIGHLAKASERKDRFIGLHFFSPVEKMPLLEIVRGPETSDETIGRCVAFTKAIGKLPILVNDGYGFYTSRVFGTYLMEAVQLVAEGHNPALIEQAAKQAGMVVAPLKVFDEVTLRLGLHGIEQRERYMGEDQSGVAGMKLLRALVEEHGRLGKAAGKGFYAYDLADRVIWPGLAALVSAKPETTGLSYIQDRLMYIQAVEVVRCIADGVIRERRDAEVGAIFGIGFTPSSGGPLAWLDRKGIPAAVGRLGELAKTCGPRYAPPAMLIEMAEKGERFWDN